MNVALGGIFTGVFTVRIHLSSHREIVRKAYRSSSL